MLKATLSIVPVSYNLCRIPSTVDPSRSPKPRETATRSRGEITATIFEKKVGRALKLFCVIPGD